jgi:hypothetical protein
LSTQQSLRGFSQSELLVLVNHYFSRGKEQSSSRRLRAHGLFYYVENLSTSDDVIDFQIGEQRNKTRARKRTVLISVPPVVLCCKLKILLHSFTISSTLPIQLVQASCYHLRSMPVSSPPISSTKASGLILVVIKRERPMILAPLRSTLKMISTQLSAMFLKESGMIFNLLLPFSRCQAVLNRSRRVHHFWVVEKMGTAHRPREAVVVTGSEISESSAQHYDLRLRSLAFRPLSCYHKPIKSC